jgi:hypothetical protein
LTAVPVLNDRSIDDLAGPSNALTEPEPLECSHTVCRQGDTRANGVKTLCPLENRDRHTTASQRHGKRQPADACTGNDYARNHTTMLRPDERTDERQMIRTDTRQ